MSNNAGMIVVGVDRSDGARAALRFAAGESRRTGRPLLALHAWREPLIFIPAEYSTDLVEREGTAAAAEALVREELEALGAELEGVVVEPVVMPGSPAQALVEASAREALIVVGRHGAGRWSRSLLGTTAEQVVHHSACPVVMVPEDWTPERGGEGVIVGIDCSDGDVAALHWALAEADARGVQLTAMHCWSFLDQHHEGANFDPAYGDDKAREAAQAHLERHLGDRAGEVALEVKCALPVDGLLEASPGAELMVVGARGLGGFKGLLLGSTSRRLLERAEVPVGVIRAT